MFAIHSQTMPGLTRERAHAGYLETASKLPLYGVSAARVTHDMMVGVSATGITGKARNAENPAQATLVCCRVGKGMEVCYMG